MDKIMLKYEEKLHLDEQYKKLQSNNVIQITIGLVWGVVVYVLLYYFIKYVFRYVPDIQPWNDFESWFTFGGIRFVKADLFYFAGGLIFNCYGTVNLSKISVQNHSVKNEKSNTPNKLLVNGYYAKVRHPMYGTFIILQAGFMISLRSFIGIIVALLIIVAQYINAFIEEKKQLIPIFGEEYNQYRKNVRGILLTKSEIIIFALAVIFSTVGFVF